MTGNMVWAGHGLISMFGGHFRTGRSRGSSLNSKILYKSREKTIEDGMKQVRKYTDRCGADEAHLIVFDRRPEVAWDEKIFCETRIYKGSETKLNQRPVKIWGM